MKKESDQKKASVPLIDYPLTPASFPSREWFRQRFTIRRNADRVFLINMELKNGWHHSFLAPHEDGKFTYGKGTYVIDESSKYFHSNSGFYCLDYHESFALPIKRSIDISGLRRTMEETGASQVEYATSPQTLERFITGKIAEQVMKGAEIDAYLQSMRMIILITLVVVIIHLVIFVIKSGMLASIHLPKLFG